MEDFYLGNKKCWETEDIDDKTAKEISIRFGLPEMLTKVLVKRGLVDADEIKNFLKPSVKNLYDPMLLPDMDKAVNRIISSRERNEKVIVYGDYDVDGITATSILYKFLKSLNMDVYFYIPDRIDEGYGISEAAVDYLSENPMDLMITVDCGISAKEPIDEIKHKLEIRNRKIDFIVTDHHQSDPGCIPDALAVVNPHLPHSVYPFRSLCGAGVAFKLVQALCLKLNLGERYLEYVDLAALGTVADIVSITGENRIIVWAGLKKIQRCPNPGIQALIEVSDIKDKEIDSYKLAFLLAPRVNAAGRMGDAARGVSLFSSSDKHGAGEIAINLHHDNYLRQKTQEEIYKKAAESIKTDPLFKEQKVIVVSGVSWHHGVIGIVASMLVEKYYKPCFVLSVSGDNETATGSARSIEGFNIFSALEYCKERLVKYGGHQQAGGLTIKTAEIDNFRKMINEYAVINLSENIMIPKTKIDTEADIEDLNLKTAEAVMAMAPFGEGNPSPVFRLNDVTVLQKKRIGAAGDHLWLKIGDEKYNIDAIAFRMGDMEPLIPFNGKIDLIFSMDINKYLGKRKLQLVIKAIRISEKNIYKNRILLEAAEKVECLDYNEEWIYNSINNNQVEYEDIRLSREELGVLYRHLQKMGSRSFTKAQLFHLADEISNGMLKLNYFKLLSGMFIFDELDIIRFSYKETGEYALQVSETIEKASLDNSMLYTFLHNLQQAVEK